MAKQDERTFETSSLTDDELRGLEASGHDVSGPTVTVPAPTAASPAPAEEKTAEGAPPAPSDKKLLDAPPPPPEVIDRARQRLDAGRKLEGDGSNYEQKNEDGEVTESKGEVKSDQPDDKETPVEAEDKANFLISILGNQPFRKTFELFGGRAKVTFRSRSSEEDALCSTQVRNDEIIDGDFGVLGSPERSGKAMHRYCEYQFLMSLVSISDPDGVARTFEQLQDPNVPEGEPQRAWTPLRNDRLNFNAEIPQPLKVALMDAHQNFENIVFQMTQKAQDPDFWKAGTED